MYIYIYVYIYTYCAKAMSDLETHTVSVFSQMMCVAIRFMLTIAKQHQHKTAKLLHVSMHHHIWLSQPMYIVYCLFCNTYYL